ncbi:hypothetical protein ACWCRD_12110 [Streptomyces sp. NPDC002092]
MASKAKFGALVAGLALTLGLAAAPAHAADYRYSGECETEGASGSIATSGWHRGVGQRTVPSIKLKVYDWVEDGHHVSIRVVAYYADGSKGYYPWHSNYDGYGTSKEFDTSATAGGVSGIWDLGIEVARFEGSHLMNYCSAGVS